MPHQVSIANSDIEFTVEDGESVLDAALRLGLPVPYGCKTGGCGACRARVVEGTVEHVHDPRALSNSERDAGLALLCQAEARSDLTVDVQLLARDGRHKVRSVPARVDVKERISHDVVHLVLQLPKARPFDYLPGQYVDILLRDGRRRSFSIASPPSADNRIEMQLRHVPGGSFVSYVINEMPDCAVLRIQGPLGGFYLRDAPERPAIFIAGGTGFAPIRAMLMDALARGETRPLHLYWGARASRDLYEHELAEQWVRDYPNLHYTPVLSEPADGDGWTGATGFVHEQVVRDFPDCSGCDVYLSGPPVLVESAKRDLADCGLRPERTFYDAFEYAFVTWPEDERPGAAR